MSPATGMVIAGNDLASAAAIRVDFGALELSYTSVLAGWLG